MSPAMSGALARLEMDSLRPGHVEEALDITADIDADGRWTRMTSRSRLRATTDGVSRTTGFCIGDPGSSAANDVTVVAGGTLGRTVRLDEHGILLAETPPRAPAEHRATRRWSSTRSRSPASSDVEFGTYAANRMASVSVWARFSPGRIPRRGWRFTQLSGQDEVLAELDAAPGASLHHALRGFGPGLMGIRWEW